MSTQDTLKDMKVSMLKASTQDTTLPPPNWSNSRTLPTEPWKSPLHTMADRLEIADGAISFRDDVIANLRRQLEEARAALAAQAPQPPAGFALVPLRMSQDMRDVTDSEGWTWEDLLAAAGAVTEEEYTAISAAPQQAQGVPADFHTHRDAWRQALVLARDSAKVSPPDIDDRAYWAHEIAAFDRAYSELAAAPQAEPVHPDDLAVDRFAARMKWKLGQKRNQGRSGWQDRAWTPEMISQALREHVEKGDPLDVANYCMFLAARNEPITQAEPQPEREPLSEEQLHTVECMDSWAKMQGLPAYSELAGIGTKGGDKR